MKRSLIGIAGTLSLLLLSAVLAFAKPASSGSEKSDHATVPSEVTAMGKMSGQCMMGDKGGGHGMMGGEGMMGGQGMMGDSGMMGMQMMQMMMNDPKTRGQMMEIHGRMMKEMGDLMIKRGQELGQGK